MPPLSFVYLGENVGPFRTKEYATAFKALTRWRDQVESLLDELPP